MRNLIILFVLLLTSTLSAQEASQSTAQFLKELDQKIPQAIQDFSIPGAAVAIIENGEIILQKGYGYADVEKGIQVDTKTGFNIGSISKTVAAWGIMKLVHEGKIDLDVPVETYLTRWHIPASEYDTDSVTVRRLLSHTAGLSLSSVSAGLDYDRLPTLEDWLSGKNDGLGPVEMIVEPGSKFEYSGGGYAVCQLIIEEVTGQKFENYMQAQILDPIGMTSSSYKISKKIRAASASPYDRYGEITDFELFTAQAAAGFHTTLEDFTRFAFACLYKHPDNSLYNTVLPPDIIQQMMEPVPNTKNWAWSVGMGYQVLELGASSVFRGHGGTNTGWQANFWVDPASNDGFMVFSNGGDNHIADLVFCRWVTWKSGSNPWGGCNPKLSIASKMKQIIDDEGIADIATTYKNIKDEQGDAYDFSEGQLNDLGHYYMAKGALDKSIAILKLNVDAFPYAFDVYDSYGEALLKKGAREEAIHKYKQSVKLNPDNESGIQVLKDLGEHTEDLIYKIPIEQLNRLEGEYLATHEEDWKIVVEVQNGLLKCKDKYYDFTLVPIADNQFVNPRFGALWRIETNKQDGQPMMLFGKFKFPKVK